MRALTEKQKAFLDAIDMQSVTFMVEDLNLNEPRIVIKNGRQMTFTGVTVEVHTYLSERLLR